MATRVSLSDPLVKKVVKAAFPEYRGRKVFLEYTDRPMNVESYWDEGSRSFYAFVRVDGAVQQVPTQHPFFGRGPGMKTYDLTAVDFPSHVVCVEHTIFCGKDCGITIHARPDALNVPRQLPA